MARSEAKPYRLVLSRRAKKDVESLPPKLKNKAGEMLRSVVAIEPARGKKLVGDLEGYRSLRLTLKDRIVYRVDEDSRTVVVLRVRSHYEV